MSNLAFTHLQVLVVRTAQFVTVRYSECDRGFFGAVWWIRLWSGRRILYSQHQYNGVEEGGRGRGFSGSARLPHYDRFDAFCPRILPSFEKTH